MDKIKLYWYNMNDILRLLIFIRKKGGNTIKQIGDRIKDLREMRNVSQKELIKYCGVSGSLFSQYENNKVTPPDEVKTKIADFFNVSVDYLLGRTDIEKGEVTDKEVVRLPIIGNVRAGIPTLAVQNIEGYQVIERRFLEPGYEYFFLKIKGDSMNVIAPEGSLVLVRKQSAVENGDVAVVLINEHEATIKKFFHHGECVTLVPASTNPEHQPKVYNPAEVDIQIIGKAVKVVSQTNL